MDQKQYLTITSELRKIESMIEDIYDEVISDRRRCPVCKNEIRIYVPFGVNMRKNAQCPICKSLERHRALWLYFQANNVFKEQNIRVLHFAPELIFINYFSLKDNVDYWPVDINPDVKGIRKVEDITNISFADCSFDVVICNHVLEHILEEKKALNEIYRILKKGGVAFLNVPIDDNREITFEKEEYDTEELRLKYYGQHDHVRIYGQDYIKRLEQASFCVTQVEPNKNYTESQLKNYGLIRNEKIFVCTK